MTVLLHIGAPKTGTTSFQSWLSRNREPLLNHGFKVYQSMLGLDNHLEIANAVIRPGRDTFGRLRGVVKDCRDQLAVEHHYASSFIAAHAHQNIVISTEALFLVRFEDEINSLLNLLGPNRCHVYIVRRKQWDFLDAYRRQLYKNPRRRSSPNFDSCCYIEADTWIADFHRVEKIYADGFGAHNVYIIDYDEAIANDGDIIPMLARKMGLPTTLIPKHRTYNLNSSSVRARETTSDPLMQPFRRRASYAIKLVLGRRLVNGLISARKRALGHAK